MPELDFPLTVVQLSIPSNLGDFGSSRREMKFSMTQLQCQLSQPWLSVAALTIDE